ncbi:hypothetical protein GCM10007111_04370 [Virgibacillus kapii]|uniref:ABC transmembrane type-1 domain-containing protein n=2 Tax=Bacillaceae TaxID=186817 RepID=A0ABQ2D475_9BACI|nr:hypothetical protein GCM10007111_04370 [Virgibacillus kapii]
MGSDCRIYGNLRKTDLRYTIFKRYYFIIFIYKKKTVGDELLSIIVKCNSLPKEEILTDVRPLWLKIFLDKAGDKMGRWLYVFYAVALAVISIFTGEIVTFIMLGFILISLQNIHSTLKELVKVNKEKV